jgi:hypothetical protein
MRGGGQRFGSCVACGRFAYRGNLALFMMVFLLLDGSTPWLPPPLGKGS